MLSGGVTQSSRSPPSSKAAGSRSLSFYFKPLWQDTSDDLPSLASIGPLAGLGLAILAIPLLLPQALTPPQAQCIFFIEVIAYTAKGMATEDWLLGFKA